MCIIIAKKAGIDPVPREHLERAWDVNSHGGGVVFFRPGDECAYMKKGMMNKEQFLAYLDTINTKENAFIAHFRIASKGIVSKMNTHPFNYEHITFAHNGTLSITPEGGKTDSQTFGDMFFRGKTIKWIKATKKLLEHCIGFSKFAIMDNHNGEIFILNKEKGDERNGVWYSNTHIFSTYTGSTYGGSCGSPQSGSAGRATTGTTTSITKATQKTSKISPQDKENGAVEELPEADITKYYLGTAYWSPNKSYIKFDKQRKAWIDSGTNTFILPEMMQGLTISREGMWRLKDFPDTGIPSYKEAKYPELITELKKHLWKSYNEKMVELKRSAIHYEDIMETANEARALWLVANTIHRMISARYVINPDTLNKVLFDHQYEREAWIGQTKSKLTPFDDFLDVINGQIQEFFDKFGDGLPTDCDFDEDEIAAQQQLLM